MSIATAAGSPGRPASVQVVPSLMRTKAAIALGMPSTPVVRPTWEWPKSASAILGWPLATRPMHSASRARSSLSAATEHARGMYAVTDERLAGLGEHPEPDHAVAGQDQ